MASPGTRPEIEFAAVAWPAWLVDYCACDRPACRSAAARRVGEAWAKDALQALRARLERVRT